MLQKSKNNGASTASLSKREASLTKREALLSKREASLKKRESCLSSQKGSKRRPARFLDEAGNEVSLADVLLDSPLSGLNLDVKRY